MQFPKKVAAAQLVTMLPITVSWRDHIKMGLYPCPLPSSILDICILIHLGTPSKLTSASVRYQLLTTMTTSVAALVADATEISSNTMHSDWIDKAQNIKERTKWNRNCVLPCQFDST